MSTDHLRCCTRQDGSKYRHKCLCPSHIIRSYSRFRATTSNDPVVEWGEWTEWSRAGGNNSANYLYNVTYDYPVSQRELIYAVVISPTVPGLTYNGALKTFEGPYTVGGGPGTITEGAPITYSFTATGKFHIEGGILNPAISDEEFIAANYTTFEGAYNLPEGEFVIQQATPLLVSQGTQRELVEDFVEKSP